MQDVVTLDFPLTNLYDTTHGAYADALRDDSDDEPAASTEITASTESASTEPTSKFQNGTALIPEEIQDLCKRIKACKLNKSGLPLHTELRSALSEQFSSRAGVLKSKSPLLRWFGDTRLFSEREWVWISGKDGKGDK